ERVVYADHVVRAGKFRRGIPVESGGIQPVAHEVEGIGLRQTVDQAHDRGVASDTSWITGKHVVAGYAVCGHAAAANRNAGKQVAVGIHQGAGIRRHAVDSTLYVPEDSAAGRRRINQGNTEALGDEAGLSNVVVLKAAEEEGLVLYNGASNVEAVLVQLEIRSRQPVGIVEPLVGIEYRIAVEVKHGAMKSVGTRARGHHHIGAAVAPVFRSGIQSHGAELLHVVRIEALDVRLRVGHCRLIGVNAVNGHVVRAVAGAEDVRSRPRRSGGSLGDARLQAQQV